MLRKGLFLLLVLVLAGVVGFAEGASFFDDPEINALIDANYAEVQEKGWAELVIPESLHHFGRDMISPNALEVGQKLIDRGYSAYIVGGTVRDFTMGTQVSDFDVATDATIEQQIAIFGDKLHLHVNNGKTFGVVYFADEGVDLAQFQNIPAPYHGLSGVPEFDPEVSVSTSPLFDSFQRDLTMNALYYDLSNGDIIDYHGGLYSIREGILDTPMDTDLALRTDPAIIRLLRFKARYGFRLSDRAEAAMRAHAREYAARFAPLENENQLRRMWFGGYAVKCFDALVDYDLFAYYHPPVADICETDEYQSYAREVLGLLDAKKAAGGIVDENEAVALLLYPAVEKLTETMPAEDAIKAVLDQEETVYEWWMDTRRLSEQCLQNLLSAEEKSVSPVEVASIEAMIEENHAEVLEKGWAKLVIPESLHHISRDVFSPNALDLGRRLLDAGYQAYLVGGGVRDLLLGKKSSDFDVLTDAPIEAQQALLGDMLELHTVMNGRTFGFVHYPSEVVDLAQFQNIPAAFYGLPNLPDFDPEAVTSTELVNDSFERDLAMNAIYYDLSNGDIIDFHGGIYDLRHGIIETMVDPSIAAGNDPTIGIRALRFAARFGFAFAGDMDAVMRDEGPSLLCWLDGDTLAFQLPKFFNEGYAARSFEVLTEYGAIPVLFPATRQVWQTDSYQQAVTRVLRSIDSRADELDNLDATVLAYAAILAYAVPNGDVDSALDAQADIYNFLDGERDAIRRQMRALIGMELAEAA